MLKLTNEQIKNLLVFLNRVQLQGNESEVLTELKLLLAKELQKTPEEPKPVKEEK